MVTFSHPCAPSDDEKYVDTITETIKECLKSFKSMALETMLSVNFLFLSTGVKGPSKKDRKVIPVLD